MTGYSARQAGKAIAGTYSKDFSEAAEGYGMSGIEGMEGEMGGQAAGKVVSKVLSGSLPKFLTGATDESIEQTKKAWAKGAIPPYRSMAPDARKLARIEVEAEKLTGKYAKQDERNHQYILSETRDMLQESGIPKPYVESIMQDLQDPYAPPFTGRQAGKILKDSVQAQVETLEHHVTQSAHTADKLIDARLSNIDRIIDAHPAGMLADDTADMIKNAKKSFSEAANGIYNRIHAMLGGARVVPTDGIRSEAKQIADMLPKTSISAMVREMSQVAKRDVSPEDALLLKEFGIDVGTDKISLADAQRIRTVLSERGGAMDLTRNVVRGDHLRIATAVDRAIQQAGEDPMAAPAIRALNEADAWYKKNIAKFKDTAIKNLVKQTKSGMPPDPNKVVNIIAAPGQTSRVTTLKNVLGDNVWKRVQSTHMGMVVRGVSSTGESGARVVDGMKLLDYLSQPENLSVFKAVHGDESASDLKELAKMLASRKGVLNPDVLAQGDVRGSLSILRESEQRLTNYLNTNLLSELRDPRKTGEDVFRWAVEPGEESRIIEVANQFGVNSQQMAELRQASLEMLARNANMKSISESGNQAISKALGEFTETQRRLLFPRGMDGDLKKLSDTIEFIFPFKTGDVSMAGFETGHVMSQPIKKRLYRQAVAAITRYVALHPTFARWIVTGRDPSTPWIYRSAEIVKQLVKLSIIDETPSQPEVQHTNPQRSMEIQAAQAQQNDPDTGPGRDDQDPSGVPGNGKNRKGEAPDNRPPP
jgi:hypothetical protein